MLICWFQFEENERKRMKAEIVRQELKHKKQWDELKSINIANEKELEQIQVTPISVSCGHVMLSRILWMNFSVALCSCKSMLNFLLNQADIAENTEICF